MSLAYTYKSVDGGDRTEIQRWPLLVWAWMFAKSGGWQSVRGYRLWSRLDGESMTVRVALRVELFSQAHYHELGKMTPRRFASLCELYGVGERCKVRGGDQRAVELAGEFLRNLMATPEMQASGGEGTDGQSGDARAPAQAEAPKCPPEG